MPYLAAGFPERVSFHGIEVVDSHHSDTFLKRHVQGLVDPAEGTERIGGVHVGVYVDDCAHVLLFL